VFFKEKISDHDVEFSFKQVGISIVIAAKNEVNNIKNLVESLKNLEYQNEKFEVILVDDHSTDNTIHEIEELVRQFQNFKTISISETENGGKRNALAKGIESTRFQNILITDADCKPEPNWLMVYSKNFSANVDFIFGVAPFKQNNFLVNKIACFENLRSSILTFAFAGLGLPYSAAARNFGFTKRAFEIVGGYIKTKQTLSGDDDLLLREAIKKKMKIGITTEKGSFVYSKTKKIFKDYLNQKARHTQTSAYYLIRHKLILGFWHLLNLLSLFSVLFMIFNPLWGILFALKLIIDLSVVKINEKKFGYSFKLFDVIFLQIVYELMLVIHFINARFIKIKWK
jgi:cellulose synthase/poly-beta-1,6-N-acetylglucosamine synthase-like glycosyltransferase